MNPQTTPLGFCPRCGKPADYDITISNRLSGTVRIGVYCGEHASEQCELQKNWIKQHEKAKKQSLPEAIKHQQKTAENIQKLMRAGEFPVAQVSDNLTRHTQ